MSDEVHPIDSPEAAESVPQRFGPRSFLKKVFIGPCGLRAGWKVLIFFLMIIAIGFCLRPLGKLSGKIDPKLPVPPGLMLFREFLRGVTVLIATGIMARFIDHRAWGYFGTPLRNAFRSSFWIGVAIGLARIARRLRIGTWQRVGEYADQCRWWAGQKRKRRWSAEGGTARPRRDLGMGLKPIPWR
jgi:hypothetical protein